MPLINESGYVAPKFFHNPHVQTMYPPIFRSLPRMRPVGHRMETPDGDFIDTDWFFCGSSRTAIISHGLEGHTRRAYVRGMARAFNLAGWDAVAYNQRGCGGTVNRLPGMYHSGWTRDLALLVDQAVERGYREIALVGFSMGANQSLKYLGEDPGAVPDQVKCCVAISAPCELEASVRALDSPMGKVYVHYLLTQLKEKIRAKHQLHPGLYPVDILPEIKDFEEFDNAFTAPIHGFADARDYWNKSSCARVLDQVRTPCLIINAKDDPFLSPSCFPYAQAENNPALHLETPAHGGHVGFVAKGPMYWSEQRSVEFAEKCDPAMG